MLGWHYLWQQLLVACGSAVVWHLQWFGLVVIKSSHYNLLLITHKRFKLILCYFARLLNVFINIYLQSYITANSEKAAVSEMHLPEDFWAFNFELTNLLQQKLMLALHTTVTSLWR